MKGFNSTVAIATNRIRYLSRGLQITQGFFLAVFSATQENGLSETLSFEEILGLSFGKMLELLGNFVENLHFHGKRLWAACTFPRMHALIMFYQEP